MEPNSDKETTFTVAYLNIHGQTGLNISKQTQIEHFVMEHDVDILNCQEINIEEDSFQHSAFIQSRYNIIENNNINRYGTAVLVKNEYIIWYIFFGFIYDGIHLWILSFWMLDLRALCSSLNFLLGCIN